MRPNPRFTRRQVLKSTAFAPLLGLASQVGASPRRAGRSELPRNVVLFMTDQERAIQHFPANWERDNLPGMTFLKDNGLSFDRAFTNACMCSPARSTWMSGYFPAQHGVKYTLEEDMPARDYPQVELPLNLPNIGTVMSAAGFNVVYKGKWHLSKPPGKHWVPRDVNRYGFTRWNPQDAGANQDLDEAGGGNADNDDRFMYDDGNWHAGREGAITWINQVAAYFQPFFLIISLVNPHDVLFYPNTYRQAGYNNSWLTGTIQIPETANEDLSTKPTVQKQFRNISTLGLGAVSTEIMQRRYLNFYGNLMKSSDGYLVDVLAALDDQDMLDDTMIIRTADHGEMGLTHGLQRQKNFNFYEEATRIPLVFSNRHFFGGARQSFSLVSHVDFLPTIARLYNAPQAALAPWQGVDYSSLILNPNAPPVQDYVVFTYDDFQSGQAHGPYPQPPNHIASIREERYKLAEYYDVNGCQPSQYEMYDLLANPLETHNIAFDPSAMTPVQREQYDRLRAKLAFVKQQRLQPLG